MTIEEVDVVVAIEEDEGHSNNSQVGVIRTIIKIRTTMTCRTKEKDHDKVVKLIKTWIQ